MQRLVQFVLSATLITVLAVTLSACGSTRNIGATSPTPNVTGPNYSASAAEVVDEAVAIMDRDGLYAQGSAWAEARKEALNTPLRTSDYPGASRAISRALGVAGGIHSSLISEDHAASAMEYPVIREYGDGVVSLLLPPFSGRTQDEIDRYVEAAWQSLERQSSTATCGWILDLRRNSGGNLWPMLGAVAPLFDSSPVLSFTDRDGSAEAVTIKNDHIALDSETMIRFDALKLEKLRTLFSTSHGAVFVGPSTASSGEAIATAFSGQRGVRVVGKPTFGVSTANREYFLGDGSTLVLTVSRFTDRRGTISGDAITPDWETSPYGTEALDAVANELRSRCE